VEESRELLLAEVLKFGDLGRLRLIQRVLARIAGEMGWTLIKSNEDEVSRDRRWKESESAIISQWALPESRGPVKVLVRDGRVEWSTEKWSTEIAAIQFHLTRTPIESMANLIRLTIREIHNKINTAIAGPVWSRRGR
jgi:hypothetical protein